MSDQTLPEKKDAVKAGTAIAALVPTSIDETFRLAKALAMSGDMVPKHFQNKPEMTMAAIVRGLEVGLAPMQALSNIAVINGRASLWGDALPAIIQRAGHTIDVELTGEGDKTVATATLIRGDTGAKIVRTFSVEDAKRAGLWGKAGPWTQYPKRMLAHRARAWAARDGAADALMGLQVAEEMSDVPPMRDVTPKPDGFAAMAQKAREEPPVHDVEILPDDEIPEFEDKEDQPDIHAFEFDEGIFAAKEGKPVSACPYPDDPTKMRDWLAGHKHYKESKK